MKIDRLIGILSILLQKDNVTAGELAKRFEVSARTIYRDIDTINMAGIPVVSSRGKNGGLYIMEGYKIDRALLSNEDMQMILAGIKGLDSVGGTNRYKRLMDKLQCAPVNVKESIIVDLSKCNNHRISENFAVIENAIDHKNIISFKYFSPTGETERKIEPYKLVFQWSSWYVWGYCLLRNDYRMFKLTRLTDLNVTGEKCDEREVPPYIQSGDFDSENEDVTVTVKFDGSVKWRVVDDQGAECPEFESDGSCILTFSWSDRPSLYEYLLGFGAHAEIIEPQQFRQEFKELVNSIGDKYKE